MNIRDGFGAFLVYWCGNPSSIEARAPQQLIRHCGILCVATVNVCAFMKSIHGLLMCVRLICQSMYSALYIQWMKERVYMCVLCADVILSLQRLLFSKFYTLNAQSASTNDSNSQILCNYAIICTHILMPHTRRCMRTKHYDKAKKIWNKRKKNIYMHGIHRHTSHETDPVQICSLAKISTERENRRITKKTHIHTEHTFKPYQTELNKNKQNQIITSHL